MPRCDTRRTTLDYQQQLLSSRQHTWPTENYVDYQDPLCNITGLLRPLWLPKIAAGPPGTCLDQQNLHWITSITPEHWQHAGPPGTSSEQQGPRRRITDLSGLPMTTLDHRNHSWVPGTTMGHQESGPPGTTLDQHGSNLAIRNFSGLPESNLRHHGPFGITRDYCGPQGHQGFHRNITDLSGLPKITVNRMDHFWALRTTTHHKGPVWI